MKYFFALWISIFALQYTHAQDLKNSSKSFTIWQDDEQEALITMKVPENADVTSSKDYVIYQEGKNTLTIDFELDDDADLTVKNAVKDGNINLLTYSAGLPDNKIAGSADYAISNKKIQPGTVIINNLTAVKITYDYVHTIVGANVTEKGKVVLYLIKTKGTSLIHTDEHPVVILLKFDEQQESGNSIDKMATAISKTIMPKT